MKLRHTNRFHAAIAMIAMTAVVVSICCMAASTGMATQHACCKGRCPAMSAAIPVFAIAHTKVPVIHLMQVHGIVPPTPAQRDVHTRTSQARIGKAILTFPLRI